MSKSTISTFQLFAMFPDQQTARVYLEGNGAVDKTKLEGDRRFPFGLPRPDNGNYVWIQIFYSALSDRGRAGFVIVKSPSLAETAAILATPALFPEGKIVRALMGDRGLGSQGLSPAPLYPV